MAANGSKLWQALGIAGIVVGLVGGTIGITSAVGPAKDVERNTAAITIVDNRSRDNERNVAVIRSQLDTILDVVREIKAAVK